MYVLVRAGSKSNMNVVAVAVAQDMNTLIQESIKDAERNYDLILQASDWRDGNAFPYVWLPDARVQYYIREIKYITSSKEL